MWCRTMSSRADHSNPGDRIIGHFSETCQPSRLRGASERNMIGCFISSVIRSFLRKYFRLLESSHDCADASEDSCSAKMWLVCTMWLTTNIENLEPMVSNPGPSNRKKTSIEGVGSDGSGWTLYARLRSSWFHAIFSAECIQHRSR